MMRKSHCFTDLVHRIKQEDKRTDKRRERRERDRDKNEKQLVSTIWWMATYVKGKEAPPKEYVSDFEGWLKSTDGSAKVSTWDIEEPGWNGCRDVSSTIGSKSEETSNPSDPALVLRYPICFAGANPGDFVRSEIDVALILFNWLV